jgi:hypothetical protein
VPDVNRWRAEISKPIKVNIQPPYHQVRQMHARGVAIRRREHNAANRNIRSKSKADVGVV